jgi:hypothetical protein
LGIFLARVVVERFHESSVLPRFTLGTVAGGAAMNIALLAFHVLFLNTSPQGFSITTACMLISLSFATGGLLRSRPLKMLLAGAAIFAAVMGTWWFHITFAASPLELTPVFRYDYGWSLVQVSVTALAVSLPIGIFGNLISMAPKEE